MKDDNGNLVVQDNDFKCHILSPLRVEFEPEEDITAYELAKILPLFLGAITKNNLPTDERILRHLIIHD